jgi:hypothetical protein
MLIYYNEVFRILLTFGKNESVKRVLWILFVAMAGLMLARVVDPVTARQEVGGSEVSIRDNKL